MALGLGGQVSPAQCFELLELAWLVVVVIGRHLAKIMFVPFQRDGCKHMPCLAGKGPVGVALQVLTVVLAAAVEVIRFLSRVEPGSLDGLLLDAAQVAGQPPADVGGRLRGSMLVEELLGCRDLGGQLGPRPPCGSTPPEPGSPCVRARRPGGPSGCRGTPAGRRRYSSRERQARELLELLPDGLRTGVGVSRLPAEPSASRSSHCRAPHPLFEFANQGDLGMGALGQEHAARRVPALEVTPLLKHGPRRSSPWFWAKRRTWCRPQAS